MQTSTITKLFIKWIKVQIWIVQSLGFKVEVCNSQLLTDKYGVILFKMFYHCIYLYYGDQI